MWGIPRGAKFFIVDALEIYVSSQHIWLVHAWILVFKCELSSENGKAFIKFLNDIHSENLPCKYSNSRLIYSPDINARHSKYDGKIDLEINLLGVDSHIGNIIGQFGQTAKETISTSKLSSLLRYLRERDVQ